MFNDLNQTDKPVSQAPVDDIFADTDKAAEAKKFSGYYPDTPAPANINNPTDVETQKAGLSSEEDAPSSKKGKIIKIVLIVLLVILLFGLGYLVYAKFLVGKNTGNVVTKIATTTPIEQEITPTEPATTSRPISEEIVVTPSVPLGTTTPPVASLVDTDGDGLTDEEENILGTNLNLKDADGDGLSDYEEVKIYNTDPLKVDTDGDGLSDYEEVKIYHTDPLKVDTDTDGHNDGEEVKNGYNPLGDGKMTDAQKSNLATSTPK